MQKRVENISGTKLQNNSWRVLARTKKCVCTNVCFNRQAMFFLLLSLLQEKKIDDLTHFETHKYERIFFYSRAHKKLLVATFGFIAISFLALKNCDDWVIWLTSFSFQPPRNIIFYFFLYFISEKTFCINSRLFCCMAHHRENFWRNCHINGK